MRRTVAAADGTWPVPVKATEFAHMFTTHDPEPPSATASYDSFQTYLPLTSVQVMGWLAASVVVRPAVAVGQDWPAL